MDGNPETDELIDLLFEELGRKNETKAEFVERIKDCYFPDEILAFFVDIEESWKHHEQIILEDNKIFLSQFKSKARSRFGAIAKLVSEITAQDPKPQKSQNFILYLMLLILTEENVLKSRLKKLKKRALNGREPNSS